MSRGADIIFAGKPTFYFWKMVIFFDNNMSAILTHGDIIAANIGGLGYSNT